MPAFVERILWPEGRWNDEGEMERAKWKKIAATV